MNIVNYVYMPNRLINNDAILNLIKVLMQEKWKSENYAGIFRLKDERLKDEMKYVSSYRDFLDNGGNNIAGGLIKENIYMLKHFSQLTAAKHVV